ncbi:M28 family peptidase [Xanthomarina sp. F2636L]|uniref:M28 family peptidase n=1 Tax=Xanthomarina sp. F2636L TaxID=2996018 RepID=UPI00225E2655|nr:M28 family peptidase [Xanthomarina sp. F2636L]MCX7550935.1 M28 family peptidase [Xanthomarina sp. F2636L]
MKRLVIIVLVLISVSSFGQTVQNLIDKVEINRLELTVSEFSGEQSTLVDGTEVTIINRQHSNNDLAAEYIKERLLQFDNLIVEEQDFNTTGKNIIATQLGKTNPDNIYLVTAHYDAIADYCADDNATGTAAVLEVARILSTQCIENTIVYAFWDEEEIGLRGSRFYANQANNNNLNILGVINMDMIGYDGDNPGETGDNDFDIDVRDLHGSLTIKDDLLSLLNTYTFNLNPIVVNPGTSASDHASFWNNGYPAVLVGESWETNDQSPYYHSSADRLSTLDLPYFHELTKLVMAYMVTKGNLLSVDNTITSSSVALTSNQDSASYQWYNCDTNTLISGETNQTFNPIVTGNYAVETTLGSCTEMSDCILFTTLAIEDVVSDYFTITPNPVTSILTINSTLKTTISIQLYNISGQLILETTSNKKRSRIDMSSYASGIYYLKLKGKEKTTKFKVVKE